MPMCLPFAKIYPSQNVLNLVNRKISLEIFRNFAYSQKFPRGCSVKDVPPTTIFVNGHQGIVIATPCLLIFD